ncbi:hypothetical protein BN938_1164 [Mucinivorans hirudinis]|uniref:Aspartate kinase n=1 Tax=Mucinivorans hirudinis TaxID=1433126 RepID=A0A060RCU6_9BACT|nr:hypothetical protein BN938_1164 [Mucinivorans hirudinis]
MTSIPTIVEETIKKKPFLESALIDGLINLSSLARKIRPEVEKYAGREVNDGAIIMALNRLVPRLELLSQIKFQKIIENIGDIVVRSNLADLAYVNSKTLFNCQSQLLERIDSQKDVFCTFSQGVGETTLIVSNSIVPLVQDIFKDETLISKSNNLSSITIKLPAENSLYPGVYYYIFKELAWDNINITELISTTNEFTVVINDSDIHRAFSILMAVKKGAAI